MRRGRSASSSPPEFGVRSEGINPDMIHQEYNILSSEIFTTACKNLSTLSEFIVKIPAIPPKLQCFQLPGPYADEPL
jgi:hypothetical protein